MRPGEASYLEVGLKLNVEVVRTDTVGDSPVLWEGDLRLALSPRRSAFPTQDGDPLWSLCMIRSLKGLILGVGVNTVLVVAVFNAVVQAI